MKIAYLLRRRGVALAAVVLSFAAAGCATGGSGRKQHSHLEVKEAPAPTFVQANEAGREVVGWTLSLPGDNL